MDRANWQTIVVLAAHSTYHRLIQKYCAILNLRNQCISMSQKKVFCFGVFDGIHDGHIRMLQEAKSYGDQLIVAVTQDQVVQKLKGHPPRLALPERIQNIQSLQIADIVTPGDADIQIWQVLQSYQPQIIALGYDQLRLKEALASASQTFSFPTKIIILQPFKPEELHSSLLFGKQD